MRNLYQINKILIIINVILGFTVFFGLLFLIPLGISQIIMSIIIVFNHKKLDKKINLLFTLYCIITTLILACIFFTWLKFIPENDVLGFSILAASVAMAFLHLKITFMIKKIIKLQNPTL